MTDNESQDQVTDQVTAAESDTEDQHLHGIVVGVDGSEHGHCALHWAAREAERRQVQLNLITAYSVPVYAASGLDGGYAAIDDSAIREGAESVLHAALDELKDYNINARARAENGDASGVLLELSEEADLLVVGTRGRGGFVGRLLGSVSAALPAHAKCNTVVVPMICGNQYGKEVQDKKLKAELARRGERKPQNKVVVGADGSDQARVAVMDAAEEAVRLGARLEVLCAVPQYSGTLAWVPAALDREQIFAEIQEQLDAGDRWIKAHFPGLEVSNTLVDGSPVEKLVEASWDSELVVVGTRGYGGFTGMLLGSTSDAVLQHAKGPIMVVPDREDPRLADRAQYGPVLGFHEG